jgi:hypothetical protein
MKDDDYAAIHACVKEAERMRSEALGRLLHLRSAGQATKQHRVVTNP